MIDKGDIMNSKKYYKKLDVIRLIACIAVLLYHLGLLKGGYLAVCTFFVLSGYLSCISAFKKEKFSWKEYYLNRLTKIYLPLLIVAFLTIAVVSIIPKVVWFNLKPEATSVLLGYNNFWQLSANLDYFARHVDSPFMHLWYISILLQFDLVFPILYSLFRKTGDKLHKVIPCICTILLSVASIIYFYNMSLSGNIMGTYYNTFTRVYSLLLGVFFGFVHSYYKVLIPKFFKNKILENLVFYLYLLILICSFIFIDSTSKYFALAMILATFISMRIIEYAKIDDGKLNIVNKVIKSLSSVSYEIYLVQYPLIFLSQYVSLDNNLKILLIVVFTLVISYIVHFSLNFKNKKYRIMRYSILGILIIISVYGAYQYFIAEDHTKEMNELKEQLAKNEENLKNNQEEYANKLKQEEDAWMETLKDLEAGESKIKETVSKLPIVGIGDSVMLGAVENLSNQFPNGYFDAKVSRSIWKASGILNDLSNRGLLGGPIVINLGANGDCPKSCKVEIMKKCGDRRVFWLNTTNDENVNKNISDFAANYSNLYVIDWKTISSGHNEYFYSDGIHLTPVGREAYTKVIYDAIYQTYLDEYNEKKQEVINKHEDNLKNKVSFYGNDMLLNVFDYLQTDFKEAKYIIDKNFKYKSISEQIKKNIDDNAITHKIVLVLDASSGLDAYEYQKLIKLCKEYKLYIVCTNNYIDTLTKYNYKNVVLINFYAEIKKHNDYLMADGIHLTDKGNKMLSQYLSENVK